MTLKEFQARFPSRANQLMWFLGAGASASAGIKTAWHMIWEFKRTLYCIERNIRINQVDDLSDERVLRAIQDGLDATGKFPAENSAAEYADYFEAAYPSPRDRQRYIDGIVTAGTPSYGHQVLAAFLRLGRAHAIWTTNFDEMVELAYSTTPGNGARLNNFNLESSDLALPALNESKWPMLVKIHGDFRSSRLKNTTEELRKQDQHLGYALTEACKRYGLLVVGYSGRDLSVMKALEEAIAEGKGYPEGLFWFVRTASSVLPQVTELIEKAKAAGIEAATIEVDTFDELMDSLLTLEKIPLEVETQLKQKRAPVTNIPLKEGQPGTWPVIRLNAILVQEYPKICRIIRCKIGGQKEVKDAIKKAGDLIIGYRIKAGIMAFGKDENIRAAFADFEPEKIDVHQINEQKLYYLNSQEFNLLYQALTKAFARTGLVRVVRHGDAYLLVENSSAHRESFAPLRREIPDQKLNGTVPNTNRIWHEAVEIRLEYRLGRLWLLLDPTVWAEPSAIRLADAATEAIAENIMRENRVAKEHCHERIKGRWNKHWNNALTGWVKVLLLEQDILELPAFGLVSGGIDATFTLSAKPAISRRLVIKA
jgi:NAD-dependent SIR2 family protein deacetylase